MLAVIYRQHANFSSHFLKADELLVITVLPNPKKIVNKSNTAESVCREQVMQTNQPRKASRGRALYKVHNVC